MVDLLWIDRLFAGIADFSWIGGYLNGLIRLNLQVEFVDFGNSDLVDPEQVYSIPPGLVTCLPAQAVPCTLAGNYGTQSENLIQPFLSLVKDNVFRIKVKIFFKETKIIKKYNSNWKDPHFPG